MTTQVSDLLASRIDLEIAAGLRRIDKSIKENRPLNQAEDREIRLLTVCTLPSLQMQWIKARRSEGHDVSDIERRMRLDATRTSRLRLVNTNSARPALYVYGDIGEAFGGITADEFRKQLQTIPDDSPLDVRIHSEGGSYTDGIAMNSLLKRRRGRNYATVDGLAASAATFPLVAADEITLARGSWLMIHEAHAGLRDGGADKFLEAAERLQQVNRQIFQLYRRRWKRTDAELQEALAKETWFTPEQAIAAGLADKISDTPAIAARAGNRWKNVPSELAIAARLADCYQLRRRRAELVLQQLYME